MLFKERTYGVLLVSASDSFNNKTKDLLPVNEYWPVHTARSVGEARRSFVTGKYDLVVINTPLPDDFGTSFAIDLAEDTPAGVLIFRILCATRERLRCMENRQKTVEEKISEVRLVNKAKWQLIQQRGMTEDEAHRYIEKQAMDRRLSKKEIAEELTAKEEE